MSVFFIASCSPAPKPISHEFTTQKKIEASQHWEILAKDFTNQITLTMKGNHWALQNAGIGHAQESEPVSSKTGEVSGDLPYIYLQTNDVSNFGKVFRSYLITALSNNGYYISNTPKGAVTARWSVKKINHEAVRIASGVPGGNTFIAIIGHGVFKLFDSSASLGIVASGIALDLLQNTGEYIAKGKVPPTEIVLGFTLSKDTIILSRQTQAYYVNEEDVNHYANIADYAGQESYLKPVKFKVTNY